MMSRPQLLSQNDITLIWGFLSKESMRKVADRYGVTYRTIFAIVEGDTYKRETRLVNAHLIRDANKAIKSRRPDVKKSDVSYLDEVAF